MVKRFRHKGLERFFSTGSKQGIRPEHAGRLKDILLRLHFSAKAQDMDFPGARLHPLKGNRAGYWSVWVSGNWRITFRFENEHAWDVNYEDYHR